MVEISIGDNNGKSSIPEELLLIFGICTTLLVVVHLMALMISTCILPNIEAVSNVHSVQAVNESPHDEMRVCVEMAWVFSTGLGILLFLTEIAILCWVKFYSFSRNTAIASTVIVIPAGISFIAFSLLFYKRLMAHKYQRHSEGLKELDEMARELQTSRDGVNII